VLSDRGDSSMSCCAQGGSLLTRFCWRPKCGWSACSGRQAGQGS